MKKRRAVWLAAGAALAAALWAAAPAWEPERGGGWASLERLYPIPGLSETVLECVEGTAVCRDMTPQGVCAAGDALLLSAYCGAGAHDSVLYVLDRETGEDLGVVPLGMRAHVGGVAFDAQHNRVYVACRDGSTAQVASLPGPALRSAARTGQPAGMERWDLPDLARASFLACRDGTLYVGTFSLSGRGVVQTYPLDEDGRPAGAVSRNGRATVRCGTAAPIPDKVQGMTFCGDNVLFSRSFGAGADSEILVFRERTGGGGYREADAVRRIPLPAMLEQIAAEGDRLYLVFESAARQYSRRAARAEDCVCAADLGRLTAP